MISVNECVQRLITQAEQDNKQLEYLELPLIEARGKIVAEAVYSDIDVPPCDNSAMDGFAFNRSDLSNSSTLPISQRIQAGHAPPPLQKGTAARIFTGANIPEGADTVEMQENCSANENEVTINSSPDIGQNIRRKGQDIAKGSRILNRGIPLRPQELGLLASTGIAKVRCFKPLRIALITTGNELVEPGNPLSNGKIYNSNRFLLDSALKNWGFDTIHNEITSDDFDATVTALERAAQNADVVISTGGVSVGEEDHIKPAVEQLGELALWKVAIKPGKPFAFGKIQNTPFIGLPGNPASVFVTLLILARPYLLRLQGISKEKIHPNNAHSCALFSKKAPRRTEYLRAKMTQEGVDIYPNQSSGMLSSASWGDCLVVQNKDEAIEQDAQVKVIPYSSLLAL